jgi:hypothetical protein
MKITQNDIIMCVDSYDVHCKLFQYYLITNIENETSVNVILLTKLQNGLFKIDSNHIDYLIQLNKCSYDIVGRFKTYIDDNLYDETTYNIMSQQLGQSIPIKDIPKHMMSK